jgi:hypothetical protein
VSAADRFENVADKETLPRSSIPDRWCLYIH